MSNSLFVGRENELNELRMLLKKKTASLVVVRGRRRIGKTRLITEFAKKQNFMHFSGLAPQQDSSAESQRAHFAQQIKQATGFPVFDTQDWTDLFLLLAKVTQDKKVIILFDEISWMAQGDPDFLPKLKDAWDRYFKSNPRMILILCGSVSSWIEKNILANTGFVGRLSFRLKLKELSLPASYQLLTQIGFKGTDHDFFKIAAVTGGIPRYLEEIKPSLSADENIRQLCFQASGTLYNEFEDIFSDVFLRKSDTYKKIVSTLAKGALTFSEICKSCNIKKNGHITEYLIDLESAGFINRDYSWRPSSGNFSKLCLYRLSDNYIRFYLRYIEKNAKAIKQDRFTYLGLSQLPSYESIMGLQFENLVLRNRNLLLQKLV